MIIERVQNQLECIYGIGIPQRAGDYLINRRAALQFTSQGPDEKIPKELLLVRKPEDDTVEVALFLDRSLMANLKTNDPFVSLNDRNFSDFCILIEGVSHFVYFLWKAQQDRPITQLELELQAEIDKFLMLFLYLRSDTGSECQTELIEKLFEGFHLFENLNLEAQDRYLTASLLAARYCHKIQKHYRSAELKPLIAEIRQFYQFSQERKIHHILNERLPSQARPA